MYKLVLEILEQELKMAEKEQAVLKSQLPKLQGLLETNEYIIDELKRAILELKATNYRLKSGTELKLIKEKKDDEYN